MKKEVDDIKEMIEKELGYEINKFNVTPLYENGKLIGFNVYVEPKNKGFITIPITISKTSDFNDNQ